MDSLQALADYQAAYRTWQSTQAELDVLVVEQDRRSREAQELRAAMADIEEVAPVRGEDAELAERANALAKSGYGTYLLELVAREREPGPTPAP